MKKSISSFSYFLAKRYMRPRRTFISIITLLCVVGVMLGVGVPIIVLSVMGGYEREMKEKLIGANPHIVIRSATLIEDWKPVYFFVKDKPSVLSASPFVTGPVMVDYNGKVVASVIRGMNWSWIDESYRLDKFLVFDQGNKKLSDGIVFVGQQWAYRNNASIQDTMSIFGARHMDSFKKALDRAENKDPLNQGEVQKLNESPSLENEEETMDLPLEVTIGNFFSTGMYDIDSQLILMTLENAQYLYGMEKSVHGVSVRIKNPMEARKIAEEWNRDLSSSLNAESWIDQNRLLFNAVATEKVVMAFVVLFILLVAAFSVCCVMITITVQKSKEIGILKALGARNSQILKIFLWQSSIIGFLGSALGVGFSALALAFRNDLRRFLLELFNTDVFSADIYNLSDIPSTPFLDNIPMILIISGGAIILCVFAALIPGYLAARVMPAKALRYE